HRGRVRPLNRGGGAIRGAVAALAGVAALGIAAHAAVRAVVLSRLAAQLEQAEQELLELHGKTVEPVHAELIDEAARDMQRAGSAQALGASLAALRQVVQHANRTAEIGSQD